VAPISVCATTAGPGGRPNKPPASCHGDSIGVQLRLPNAAQPAPARRNAAIGPSACSWAMQNGPRPAAPRQLLTLHPTPRRGAQLVSKHRPATSCCHARRRIPTVTKVRRPPWCTATEAGMPSRPVWMRLFALHRERWSLAREILIARHRGIRLDPLQFPTAADRPGRVTARALATPPRLHPMPAGCRDRAGAGPSQQSSLAVSDARETASELRCDRCTWSHSSAAARCGCGP